METAHSIGALEQSVLRSKVNWWVGGFRFGTYSYILAVDKERMLWSRYALTLIIRVILHTGPASVREQASVELNPRKCLRRSNLGGSGGGSPSMPLA